MSYFQQSIAFASGAGVPGEAYNNGPIRSQPFILNSVSAANNVFGRAFTVVSQGVAQAGNPSALADSKLAGVLVNPKGSALYGTSGAPLAPTLTLPNSVNAEIANMGSIWVTLPAAAAIGDWVVYDNTTGALSTVTPGTALAAGTSALNAIVDVFTVSAAGLAVITMTKLPGVPVTAAP